MGIKAVEKFSEDTGRERKRTEDCSVESTVDKGASSQPLASARETQLARRKFRRESRTSSNPKQPADTSQSHLRLPKSILIPNSASRPVRPQKRPIPNLILQFPDANSQISR